MSERMEITAPTIVLTTRMPRLYGLRLLAASALLGLASWVSGHALRIEVEWPA